MPRKGIREIRERIRTKNYEVTGHAEEEREDDNLAVADLRDAILAGRVVQILTDDPRGNRYVVRGKAQDEREIEVVCRFLASGKLRILTVYAVEEEYNMQDEACEYCNGELRPKTVTVHYRHKGKLVLIENVPARVCRRCGERYYDAGTVEKMEAVARRKGAAERTLIVPIRDFAKTAA